MTKTTKRLINLKYIYLALFLNTFNTAFSQISVSPVLGSNFFDVEELNANLKENQFEKLPANYLVAP